MAGGRGGSAARQDEILEGRQRVVEGVEHLLELHDALGLDGLRAGDAELAAEIEQVVLDLGEAARHRGRKPGHREDHADGAVGFVDRAISLDARMILAYPGAIPQSRGAVIACARIDPAQAMSHGTSSRLFEAVTHSYGVRAALG